jgi:hypothetical protein
MRAVHAKWRGLPQLTHSPESAAITDHHSNSQAPVVTFEEKPTAQLGDRGVVQFQHYFHVVVASINSTEHDFPIT